MKKKLGDFIGFIICVGIVFPHFCNCGISNGSVCKSISKCTAFVKQDFAYKRKSVVCIFGYYSDYDCNHIFG